MKTKTVFIALMLTLSTYAWSVPPGMKIVFDKSPMGPVVFQGKIHADKGVQCVACHPKLFKQKKGTAKIKLVDHQEGKQYCFSCHNGKSAFPTTNNCNKCHQKTVK